VEGLAKRLRRGLREIREVQGVKQGRDIATPKIAIKAELGDKRVLLEVRVVKPRHGSPLLPGLVISRDQRSRFRGALGGGRPGPARVRGLL
jgi:hypothetical protein